MILLDTHIFVWLAIEDKKLSRKYLEILETVNERALSIMSCWEIAKLVEKGKLRFNVPIAEWLQTALDFNNIQILQLEIDIIADSISLPGKFHKDPADQLIVATARVLDIELMTVDEKIVNYPYVKLVKV